MRASNIASCLNSYYHNDSNVEWTYRIIGSYGKGTAVSPPRDVDMLFLPPVEIYYRFNGYSGNGQSALLQEVRSVLQSRYPSTSIRGDGQVVVVTFKSGHKVEVLPAWKANKSNKYIVPNTHDGGKWNTVDHDAEISNVENSDTRSRGNTRNLIKMMKVWQTYCNVPIKSLALELRSVSFLASWENYKKGTTYYDWMVRDFFGELIKKANSWCTIPGIDEKCMYHDDWLSKAESAYNRAIKACDYEASNNDAAAAEEWRKIFGAQYGY